MHGKLIGIRMAIHLKANIWPRFESSTFLFGCDYRVRLSSAIVGHPKTRPKRQVNWWTTNIDKSSERLNEREREREMRNQRQMERFDNCLINHSVQILFHSKTIESSDVKPEAMTTTLKSRK
jgi:hypothetical protein